MKKTFRLLSVVCTLSALLIAACGSPAVSESPSEAPPAADNGTNAAAPETKEEAPAKPVTLEFASNAKESTLEAYAAIAERFREEHPHITVEVVGVPKDFEAQMNARMANNDLPDLWTTHGWAVRKYGEYLLPLNDQPWIGGLVDEIKPIVTDEATGNVYALPLDVDLSGLIYNRKLLDELNLEVPETWEQFLAASETIKNAGYTPIHLGGKDTSDVAGFVSRISLSLLAPNEQAAAGRQLLDGTFDWSEFRAVTDFILQLKEKGYLNVDHLTADKAATYAAFAENKAAFAFQSNQSIYEILKLNPEAQVSMMRLPVSGEGAEPFLISGERNAVGVWKDTPHREEALLFLEFLAKPEHVSAIAATYSLPAAFEGVEVELGELAAAFRAFESVPVSNHFDREYLPNGMWNTLKSVGPGLLSGEMDSERAAAVMKEDYDRLRAGQ